MSLTLIKYILLTALREKLLQAVILLIALISCLSVFMGSSAVAEQDQFTVVYGAGSLRIFGVVGVVLFTVFYIRNAFFSKDVEYVLSRPISRTAYLLSHGAAFGVLAVLLGVMVNLAVYAMGPHMFGAGSLLWGYSIIAELVLMAWVSLFFSMVLSSPTSGVLACFAFYVLARMIGQVMAIMDSGFTVLGIDVLNYVMEVVSLIIPRLDLMGQSSWLVYGAGDQIGYIYVSVHALVFGAMVLMAALIDLVRREF